MERSEFNRRELENSFEIQSRFVNRVIQGLEKSQAEAENRNCELQKAFQDLQVMQTKLVESEKMSALGVLVAGIAHEINNPINFIHVNIGHSQNYVKTLLALLELYQRNYPEPTDEILDAMEDCDLEFVIRDLFKLLKSMQVGSARIRNIVVGLRTFSRLGEAEYKEVDLHEGLESTLMILHHRLKGCSNRPDITVTTEYGPLPKVHCFAAQLNQVFMNIIVNAIDAIDALYAQNPPPQNKNERACISIRTSVRERGVEIAISDRGVGMPESVRQKIFNPFYTTKSVGKGSGMGLAIAYQIVTEKHRGQLSCSSELGEGTTLTLQIPTDVDPSLL